MNKYFRQSIGLITGALASIVLLFSSHLYAEFSSPENVEGAATISVALNAAEATVLQQMQCPGCSKKSSISVVASLTGRTGIFQLKPAVINNRV